MLKPKSPEYKALHYKIAQLFPKTGVCEHCSQEKRTCYSSVDHVYTLLRDDWRELCYSCHARFDHRSGCKRGHVREISGWQDKLGKWHCRECARLREERKRRAAGIEPGPHHKVASPEYIAGRQRDDKGHFVCAS